MGFYEQRAASALRLIKKYGMTMTVRRVTKGEYNSEAGERAADVVLSLDGKGIIEEYETKEIDGTLIQAGDRKIILAASGLAIRPKKGDLLVIDGAISQIVKNKPTSPGGVDIIHNLQIRD